MLVARIEIHPFGDDREAQEIRTVRIGNVGRTGIGNECRYVATVANRRGVFAGPAAFVHNRDDGAERCVARALDALDTPSALRTGREWIKGLTPSALENLGLEP